MEEEKKEVVEKNTETTVEGTTEPIEQIVFRLDPEHIKIHDIIYTIVEEHQQAVDIEALNKRYHDILDKYDYIVGDWGFEQLRLTGFYKNDRKRVNAEKKIHYLQDYLYEFCNFGCSYFVIERDPEAPYIEQPKVKEERMVKKRHKQKNYGQKKHYAERHPNRGYEEKPSFQKKKRDSWNKRSNNKKRNKAFVRNDYQEVVPHHKTPERTVVKKTRNKTFKMRELED